MLQEYSDSKEVKNNQDYYDVNIEENAVLRGLTRYWTAVYDKIDFTEGKTTLRSLRDYSLILAISVSVLKNLSIKMRKNGDYAKMKWSQKISFFWKAVEY